VSALCTRRLARLTVGLCLALTGRLLLADSPSAVVDPAGYRESITPDRLREAGYNPEEYRLQVPLGRLQFERTYVRAGEEGLLSTGLTERGVDVVRLSLNPRGSLEFSQDAARTALHGVELTSSTQRTAALSQGFGGGATTGTLSLTHLDTYSADVTQGFRSSRNDRVGLTLGLGRALGLTASLEDAEGMALLGTRTRKFDMALTPTNLAVPLVEYHETSTTVGLGTTEVTQLTLRTPTVEVGGIATVAASHAVTDSSATGTNTVDTLNLTARPTDTVSLAATRVIAESAAAGTDTVDTVNLAANPTDAVGVTASHVASERESAADTAVTTLGSSIRVRPDTTVNAGYVRSRTEGVGTNIQRAVAVAMAPADGRGLGVEASYTDISAPSAQVDPTVRVKLSYAAPSRWQVSGQYYDDNARPDPELGASVRAPVLGGELGLTYSERVYDATANSVRMTRSYGTELTRPLLWGLSGRVGYQRTDNLTDPTSGERLRIGLSGATTPLGAVDMQYETGWRETGTGELPDGSTISLSLSRRLGSTEVAVTGKRAVPSAATGSPVPGDEIHVDLRASW